MKNVIKFLLISNFTLFAVGCGHSHTEYKSVYVTLKEPTCTESGLERNDMYCSCGELLWSNTHTISALGHNYVEVNRTHADYENNGYIFYSCSRCGAERQVLYEDRLSHNFSSDWTYNEYSHWHRCYDDGYSDLESDNSPHEFDSGTKVNPTNDEKGYIKYTCSVCGYEKKSDYTYSLSEMFVVTPELPHSFGVPGTFGPHEVYYAFIRILSIRYQISSGIIFNLTVNYAEQPGSSEIKKTGNDFCSFKVYDSDGIVYSTSFFPSMSGEQVIRITISSYQYTFNARQQYRLVIEKM